MLRLSSESSKFCISGLTFVDNFLFHAQNVSLLLAVQLYHILGLNQLVVWFASVTRPNLDFKNIWDTKMKF